jgi:hypothetical protein
MAINRAFPHDYSLPNLTRLASFILAALLVTISTLAEGQGYPVGQPAVGNSTNLLAFSNASVDASLMPGTGSICAKIAQAASIASSAGIAVIDARGFTGNQTCSPLDAASTFNNWPTGGVLLLGNVTITLGSLKTLSSLTQVNCTNVNPSVCTVTVPTANWIQGAYASFAGVANTTGLNGNTYKLQSGTTSTSLVFTATANLNTGGTISDSGTVTALGTPAWEVPNKAKIIGTAAVNSVILADNMNCNAFPATSCDNFGIRLATISSTIVTGTGNQCTVSGNKCWVNLTLTGGVNSLGLVPPPASGEIVQVRSKTGASNDNNWGTYILCNHTKPSNNGGCPLSGQPTSTSIAFYNGRATAGSNAGSVYFGTPLLSFSQAAPLESTAAIDATQVQVEKVSVDCNGVTGCISVQNVSAEEETYLAWSSLKGSNFAALDIHNGGASGGSNAGPYQGNQIILATGLSGTISCDYDTIGAYFGDAFYRDVIGMTIVNPGTNLCNYSGPTNSGGGSVPQQAILYDQTQGGNRLSQFHIEGFQTGFEVGANRPSSGMHIDGFHGSGTVNNCIDISNNFSNGGASQTGAITISRISQGKDAGVSGCPTATFTDNMQNIVNTQSVTGEYVWDGTGGNGTPGSGTFNIFNTDPSFPQQFGGGYKSKQIIQVTLANFTTTSATLVPVTGLSWTSPINNQGAQNWSFHCVIPYSSSSASATVAFGIQGATNAPTSMFAIGNMYTSNAGVSKQAAQTITTTTATTVVSGTPSAMTTTFLAEMDGTAELQSSTTASNKQTTLNLMVDTSTGTLTILRGAYCSIF